MCTEQPCCTDPAGAGRGARTTPAIDILCISKTLKFDIIQIFTLISLTQVDAGFSSIYITDTILQSEQALIIAFMNPVLLQVRKLGPRSKSKVNCSKLYNQEMSELSQAPCLSDKDFFRYHRYRAASRPGEREGEGDKERQRQR